MQSSASTGISFSGEDTISQIVTGIAIVALLYMSMAAAEFFYQSFMALWKNKVELFSDTYASGSNMYTANQNPFTPKARTVHLSENQRSGVEFSYSMFVYINSSTFASGNANLYHILHKGYNQFYPLLGPGIFCWGNKNVIRIYMNCYDTWDNYSDVENIPVEKWFHLVVSCKGNTLYIYINGNLKQKVALSGNTPPYQNYGNVYLFSSRKISISPTITQSLNRNSDFANGDMASGLNFDGTASGMASRVYYFSYALTYTEIQSLMKMGPSKIMAGNNMTLTPYLSDTWWINKEGP